MSEIRVPDLGENIDEAAVLRVLVAEGQRIEANQAILELESDKASFELPSPEAGVVRKITVHEGDTVKVGQPVIELDGGAAPTEERAAKAPEKEAEEAPKKVAEEAPKKALEEAPEEIVEPRLREVQARPEPAPGAPIGGPIQEPAPSEGAPERETRPREQAAAEAGAPEHEARPTEPSEPSIAVGPATRRFARELGVDLTDIARHAHTKHVTREHILAYVRGQAGPERGDERVRMDRVRRISADRLAAAWREVPHVTHHELADITELEQSRRALRAEEPDVKLTVTALAAKACTIALRAHPRLNSSLDLERGEIVLHHAYHIGIAVDTEHGLLVPVVRDAAHKSTRELAAEIAELSDRARNRKLGPDELAGATFSITNLGGISGTAFTPIVVPPQVAILGLSRARAAELLQPGAPSERIWLPLSLSYDHRAVDGAEAARFVADLVRLFQSPMRLLLDC